MNQQTKQVKESLEPTVTTQDLQIAARYNQLVEDFDLIRNRYDIRYHGSHELTYTQRIQLKKVQEYEAELRRYLK